MKKVEKYSKRYLKDEIREIEGSGRNVEVPELDVFEKSVIYKYSNDGYDGLNERLRKSKGRNNSEFGKILDTVLLKMPNYEGLVYRGAELTPVELDRYKTSCDQKSPIVEPTFVSTSKSRLIAMEFKKNTLFVIYSKTGKEIEKIAKFGIFTPPNEKEVLFRPNRKFRILEITKESNNMLVIMEEVIT